MEENKEINDTNQEELEDTYLNCCSCEKRNKNLKEENDLIIQQLEARKLSVSIYNLNLRNFLLNMR